MKTLMFALTALVVVLMGTPVLGAALTKSELQDVFRDYLYDNTDLIGTCIGTALTMAAMGELVSTAKEIVDMREKVGGDFIIMFEEMADYIDFTTDKKENLWLLIENQTKRTTKELVDTRTKQKTAKMNVTYKLCLSTLMVYAQMKGVMKRHP